MSESAAKLVTEAESLKTSIAELTAASQTKTERDNRSLSAAVALAGALCDHLESLEEA